MLKAFALRHFVTAGVYTLLALAALIIYLAGLPPTLAQGSLKDGPVYALPRAVKLQPMKLQSVERAAPLPTPKPEGERQLWEAEELEPGGPLSLTERRLLLLRCSSYYLIAADIQSPIFADNPEVTQYRLRARALLREASKPLNKPLGVALQDNIFLEVYQEFVEGPKTEVGLYERYNELCGIVVRPLLRNTKD